jgi:riboflavin kinase/FMN adenylyltransferase
VVSSTRIRALIAKGEHSEASALLGRPHEVRGLVVGGDAPEPGAPPRLAVEVPGEILLPPAGEYLGFALSDGGESVAARLVVADRVGKGPQRIEISGVEVPPARIAFHGAMGEVVRARFG